MNSRSTLRAFLGLVVIGLAGMTQTAAANSPAFSGDRQGLALIERVNDSYRNVPAVSARAQMPTATIVFTLHLRHGIAWAEQAVITSQRGTTMLVGTKQSGTYARDAGRKCWRFVPKSDPQALEDIGHPILVGPGRVGQPRVSAKTITIDVTVSGKLETFVIDRQTLHVHEMHTPAVHLSVRFATLQLAPPRVTPRPRC